MSIKRIKIDSNITNKNYQYIQELNSAYLKKRLIIFYGAGLSIPFGLPSWAKLQEYVVEKVIEDPKERKQCIEKTSNNDFWTSMEYIKDLARVDEAKIKSLIAECIKGIQDNNEDDLCSIDNNYKDLSKSEIAFFMTTNYDTFLEKVDKRCEEYDIDDLKNQALADFFRPDERKKKIIYLHGHVNNESSIVITKEGVESIYQNEKWISIFQNLLTGYHILFIGVSFEDEYLRDFLKSNIEKSHNSYYIITNRDVDIPCKKIVIPKEYENRVFHIRTILNKIKQKPEETVWVRVWVEPSNIDNFRDNVSRKLDNEKDIKYEIITNRRNNSVIIAAIHMKQSENIRDAVKLYTNILEYKSVKKYICNYNKVYFYSCNKDNFNEIDYKKIFKNHIMHLFQEQVLENSKGYIVDRIGLESNRSNTNLFEKFQMVRCYLGSNETVEVDNQQKEYSFYIDENVFVKNAKGYGVEVHVSGFCFFDDKLLMENRSEKTAIASGMVAPIGGRMRTEENFLQSLERHFRQDCNLIIDNIKLCDIFTTFNANVPGVAFICNSKGVYRKNRRVNIKCDLYTKEQLVKLHDEGKLACTKDLLLKACNQMQEIRKKSIKLRIVLWSNCCYKCKGCHHENLKNISTVYNNRKLLKNLKKLGEIFDIRQITITGGEPLQDVIQLENILKDINGSFPMTDIAIITNGERLTKSVIETFRKYNVRYKISLYGYDNQSFKEYTGYNGYAKDEYLATFQNKLKLLNENKIRFTVNIPIHKYIIKGIKQLFDNNRMQEILLEQNVPIKVIDMVKPRSEDIETFQELYISLQEVKKCLSTSNVTSDINKFQKLKKNIDYFVYPCKGCKGINQNCLENFALTLEPDGKLLVCKNAIENIYFDNQSFVDFLGTKGIEVELAEYNKEYGTSIGKNITKE